MKSYNLLASFIVLFSFILGVVAQPLKIAPPDSYGANWDTYYLANSCQPPEDEDKYNLTMGFACPRLMLSSREMEKAALFDAKKNNWWKVKGKKTYFAYGVVGRDPGPDIDEGCCACFQLQFDDPSVQPLIVQWINTKANGCSDPAVGDCNFDLFMGAGGTGNYNSCIRGKANSSKFEQFMYGKYPWEGQPWQGGVSDPRNCIFKGKSWYSTKTTTRSCKKGINKKYKGNPTTSWHRVKCPYGLIRVTGCKRIDDRGQKKPILNADTEGWNKGYVTSMQDCCLPSCAWANNVQNSKDPWNNVYSCNDKGKPWTIKNPMPPPTPKVSNCCSWDACQSCGSDLYCNANKYQCEGGCSGTWCP